MISCVVSPQRDGRKSCFQLFGPMTPWVNALVPLGVLLKNRKSVKVRVSSVGFGPVLQAPTR